MGKRLFEVWCEGHQCTGDRGSAFKMGESEADTFLQACQNLSDSGVISQDPNYCLKIRDGIPTVWACKLFDNEIDARKNFGYIIV